MRRPFAAGGVLAALGAGAMVASGPAIAVVPSAPVLNPPPTVQMSNANGFTANADSTITVSGASGVVRDVDVTTRLSGLAGGAEMTLTSPGGRKVVLISTRAPNSGPGGYSDGSYDGTVWDDQVTVLAVDALAYRPSGVMPSLVPEGAFGALIGENPNGDWTLSIRFPLAGAWQFSGWSIDIATTPAPATRPS